MHTQPLAGVPRHSPSLLDVELTHTPSPFNPHAWLGLTQILGPDVAEFEYVTWTADQDAYAYSGQKCSAQSILFAHENWVKAGLEARLKVCR